MRIILLPALLIYAALIYWLLKYFDFKTIWASDLQTMSSQNSRLTLFVKRVLDVILVFILTVLILWLPVIIVMEISQTSGSTWGIDIAVFAGFKIDLNELPGIVFEGLRHPEIRGNTLVNIDTSSSYAWYMFAFHQLLSAVISLYTLIQVRALVISLMKGLPFNSQNVDRVKQIGLVVIAWNILSPFYQYFGWGSVIEQISINSSGIQLYRSFELNPFGILIGLLLILLSGMMKEATAMRNEQELTI
ncbi:MAG: hypothetical protein ACJAS9_000053 [Polaribacter sp.]|jgi:hypothetical protein